MGRALTYFFEEAITSLRRGRGMTLLSIVTIATALLTLGGFLWMNTNLEHVLSRWSAGAEFSVYLRDDITEDGRVTVNRVLTDSGLVGTRDYVSKTEALQRFRRDFPDLSRAASSLDTNPLPASIEVRLKPDAGGSDRAIDALADRLRTTDGVADVRFDRHWLNRLTRAVSAVRWLALSLAAILAIAGALTVATVVRLALYARHEEIEIMQLVGAPYAYLRGPLIVEGIIQGGLGAVMALVALVAAFVVVKLRYGAALANILAPSPLSFLPWDLCLVLVAGGVVVGCAGGVIAARTVK